MSEGVELIFSEERTVPNKLKLCPHSEVRAHYISELSLLCVDLDYTLETYANTTAEAIQRVAMKECPHKRIGETIETRSAAVRRAVELADEWHAFCERELEKAITVSKREATS